MEKNTGISYENVTQEIFNQIINQDAVETVKIEHNVILQGKTTSHQIDVYWKFKIGGITYETIIQAKDWKSKVKQEQLLAFKSILDDLPGQPKGIFVTRTGYQKGAKLYSDSHGILLYELREPTDHDWKDRVKEINISGKMYIPSSTDTKFNFDIEWAKAEKEKLNLPNDKEIQINISGLDSEIFLFDDSHKNISSVRDLVQSLFPKGFSEFPPTVLTHMFDTPTFISTNVPEFPKLKLESLETTISVSVLNNNINIDGAELIGFILKNVTNDTEKRFTKDLRLLDKE